MYFYLFLQLRQDAEDGNLAFTFSSYDPVDTKPLMVYYIEFFNVKECCHTFSKSKISLFAIYLYLFLYFIA